MIFDTHAHYDDHAFDGDREAVLASLAEKGVGSVVDVAASVSSLERVKALADTYDFVYGAVGLHPDEVGAHSREARSGAVFTCTADGVTREELVRGLTDMVYGRLRELRLKSSTALGLPATAFLPSASTCPRPRTARPFPFRRAGYAAGH